jgi:hypothetical protein
MQADALARSDWVLLLTKAETDALIELACSFDLRWPVKQPGAARALRQVEDLKHHHYQVGSLLTQRRVERAMATQLGRRLGHRQFPATVTTIQQPQPAPPPPSFATAIPPTEMAAL